MIALPAMASRTSFTLISRRVLWSTACYEKSILPVWNFSRMATRVSMAPSTGSLYKLRTLARPCRSRMLVGVALATSSANRRVGPGPAKDQLLRAQDVENGALQARTMPHPDRCTAAPLGRCGRTPPIRGVRRTGPGAHGKSAIVDAPMSARWVTEAYQTEEQRRDGRRGP